MTHSFVVTIETFAKFVLGFSWASILSNGAANLEAKCYSGLDHEVLAAQ